MAESVEAVFAVVAPHAAVADAAEGHFRSRQVNDRVVYAAAAVRNAFDDKVDVLF